MALRVLLAGGGTGGHAVPALAIAEAVRRRRPDVEIRFVGTRRGVEARMIPNAGYRLETIPVIGLKRHLHPDLLRFPWMLFQSFYRSLRLISAFHPHLVICTGGYVSGPVGVAAWLLGLPLVLHEQNNFPGLTDRMLSRGAAQIYLAFAGAGRRLGGRFHQVVGNPTRAGWQAMDRAEARRRFGLSADRQTLVVVGGSQGARGINRGLIEALPALMARGLQILWQTGRPDNEKVVQASEPWSERVRPVVFIDDMAAAYSAADLALTRSGAMTLAELTLMGVPAVLVPLPTAAENHQEYNARAMQRAGAARMIREAELTGETLAAAVLELMTDPDRRGNMAARSRALAAPDAADRIAAAIESAGFLEG